jgi:hypothetical protein
MKGIEKKIREIKEQKIGNSGRQVLVVEGRSYCQILCMAGQAAVLSD